MDVYLKGRYYLVNKADKVYCYYRKNECKDRILFIFSWSQLGMPKYRSSTTIHGRNMAGARALWRATGVKESDFGKPIIAVVNSFTQFVPGHIHLQKIGTIIGKQIQISGAISKEFNTIAIDDGIAMGHSGMFYSLPSRELIADSIEYMINAHCVDSMVCVSNCDKITPGMLMAAMRLNIPTIFISGGPMEAGKIKVSNEFIKLDLIDAMIQGANPRTSNVLSKKIERFACPTCGSCSGMFTANSMNCLIEALGLSEPGNGTLLAVHMDRREIFIKTAKRIVSLTKRFYEEDDKEVLPKAIATREAFKNAMTVDISMGGSTNTVLHLLAAAQEGGVNFSISDIDYLSRKTPQLCKISPNSRKYYIEDFHRAGGVIGIMGELDRAGLLNTNVRSVLCMNLREIIDNYDIFLTKNEKIKKMFLAAPAGVRTIFPFSQNARWKTLDKDRKVGCIRSSQFAFSQDGGLAVLYGNLATDGCLIKTSGINTEKLVFKGPAKVYESQEDAVKGILEKEVVDGNVVVIRYEGPKGGPGMQEMLYPTSYLKSMELDKTCALITDGRFSGGTSGFSVGHISPEAANKGVIALIKNGDLIELDIPNRRITLLVSKNELLLRRLEEEKRGNMAYTPNCRERKISFALRAYALLATSADKGAVRDRTKLGD